MDTFGANGEEGRGYTHKFSSTDHRGASVTDSRQYMGDARGGSIAVIGVNAFGNDLHRETTGNRGTVGGVSINL